MTNDNIADTVFSIILHIYKSHNRADVDSIHKQIIKTVDLKNITIRIHAVITDGKIINIINCNADSYYVNEKHIDTKSLNLQNTSPIKPDKSF